MKRANYHTHTPRCGHAQGSEREYIEAAIEAGMEALGFSDHVPQPYHGFVSPIRMQMQELSGYVDTLLKLRQEYGSQIQIKIGFEVEYIPSLFDSLMKIMDDYPVDYYILGQHFLNEEITENYCGKKFIDCQRLIDYVDTVLEGLSTGCFSYLAHPDLINFAGKGEFYDDQMGRLCRECKKLDIPLEINRLGVFEARTYPRVEFFQLAAREENRVIIGYDAHIPSALTDEVTYTQCLDFARKLGITPEESYRI